MDKREGTYNHCSSCSIKKNCCCDFDDEIDNIIVTAEEKNALIQRTGQEYEKYFRKINDKAYNILNIDSKCPFYKKGCTVYDIRPSDCRLFPFDLKNIDGKYYLIRYDLPCGSKQVNEDNLDSIINTLKTIIETYTDKKLEERVNRLKFDIIREIEM